ncbi:hypothetical protein X739_13625 [Mesorhizobium sp. LNHC220B00]|nr:hypothetical protein X739_13625 [Mesorhizobium sp. LNHC220B00]ESY97616.1 hypothetical protein X741_00410 [Mesorhizobium sp. LNHC229A00]ESZ01891.1 hypothetical protein X738_03110 [Mesorhizobium sp. LNHC209A00]
MSVGGRHAGFDDAIGGANGKKVLAIVQRRRWEGRI